MLSPWVTVESGAEVSDSVLFEKVRVVAAGATIGVDHDLDRSRGFAVTPSGIVVVEKGVHVT